MHHTVWMNLKSDLINIDMYKENKNWNIYTYIPLNLLVLKSYKFLEQIFKEELLKPWGIKYIRCELTQSIQYHMTIEVLLY